MAAAGAGSRVLLLVGAGLTGSLLVGNQKLSDVVSDLTKVVMKHVNAGGEAAGEAADASSAAVLHQVKRLAAELRQLAASQRPITVVHSGPSQGGGPLTLVVPIVVVGAASYGYMWWKGMSFNDLMYVTRKSMSNAVGSVTKQMDLLSQALAQTRQQLASRIAVVSKTLEESVEMTGIIKDQVLEVREDIERVGQDVESVQRMVQGLELKLDTVTEKQDFANHGIILLCRFVTQSLEGRQKQEALQGISILSRARIEGPGAGSSASALPGSTLGLKDLQSLADSLSERDGHLIVMPTLTMTSSQAAALARSGSSVSEASVFVQP